MFTVCPKCTLTLAVTANDLRVGQGYVRCGRCANVFNALLTLSEEPTEPGPASASPASLAASGNQAVMAGGAAAPAPTHSQALPTDGPQTHLHTELSFDGSIENQSSRAEGTGTFETILLEGDAITQTEEFVPEESVDSELEALTRRLGVPAHELSAASTQPAAPDGSEEPAAEQDAAPLDLAPAAAARPLAHRWAWIAGSVLLVLLLAAQIVHHWRDSLAQSPLWSRPLARLYGSIGLPLNPHWSLAAYDVRQQGASVDPADGHAIHVRLSLANHAPRAQPMPLLRLTLLDRYGKRIAAREITPQEYTPHGQAPRAFLGRDERIDSEITVRDPGSDSASFELDVCLSLQGQVHCAGDALASANALAASTP
jgi:predicted Zn finger-like uncharacterized protein